MTAIKRTLPNIDDEYLLKACADGSSAAIELLYNKYKNRLFGIAMRYSNSKEMAEDVMHDGFVNIIRSIGSIKHHEALYSYMVRTTIHTAYRLNQHWQNRRTELDVLPDTGAPEHFDGQHSLQLKELMSLIQELPTGYRMVFNLFVIDGYKHEEIAKLLEISEGTSKSQLNRAKQMLQKKILKLQYNEITEKGVSNGTV